MNHKKLRVLFILTNQIYIHNQIDEKIDTLKAAMKKFSAYNENGVEFYLLYSGIHVPGYALQSPEMVYYAMHEVEHDRKILRALGMRLDLPEDNLFLAKGNFDLYAARLAHEYQFDKVIGHSHWFSSMQLFFRHFRLKRVFAR